MPDGGSFYRELREGSDAFIKGQRQEGNFVGAKRKKEFWYKRGYWFTTFRLRTRRLICSIQPVGGGWLMPVEEVAVVNSFTNLRHSDTPKALPELPAYSQELRRAPATNKPQLSEAGSKLRKTT